MSKFSSRSPSKKNSFQIDNLLQPSNRESKNVKISSIELNNISISNRKSKNVGISNRESKNINWIIIKQQQSIKISISSSNQDSKNLNYYSKTKTEQSYFEIKKELGLFKRKKW